MVNQIVALFPDQRLAMVTLVGVVVLLYVLTVLIVLIRYRNRKTAPRQRLWEALGKGLRSGAVATVEDVVNIYKGIHGLGGEDQSYRAGLTHDLREYLVSVVSEKDRKGEAAKATKEKVTAIINAIEQEDPFSDLPAAERDMLMDVQRLLDQGDAKTAKRKLRDLAGLIEVRQEALEKLQASNRWSVPLAVVGMILTVIFGIVSLI